MKDYKGNATGLFTGIVEVWKDIDGYEGIYQVSSFGEVRSVDRICIRSDGYRLNFKSKVLKKELKIDGYYAVTLCNVARKNMYIHRLVALAFIENTMCKSTVNHVDGYKLNNNVSNLEWSTHTEQMVHAVENKLTLPHKGRKFSMNEKQEVKDYYERTGCSLNELSKLFNMDRSSAVRFAKGKFSSRNKIKQEDIDTVKQFLLDGKTLEEIGTHFNCCSRSVYEFNKRNGLNKGDRW